jgi:hypothetical protein
MDDLFRAAMRSVKAEGQEVELVIELISQMSKKQLADIVSECSNHLDRQRLKWRQRDKKAIIISELESKHLYNILKGIESGKFRYPRVNVRRALRLEAEMRGILVGNELHDPSLEEGRRLPYGLLSQCKGESNET